MSNQKSDAELTSEIEEDISSGRFLEGLKHVKNVNAKPPRAVYSLRLSLEEAQEFEAAAKLRGVTMSDFLRSAARASLEADKTSAIGEARQKARELTDALSRI